MAVKQTNKLTITADGQQDALELPHCDTKVYVVYGSGAAGTLTPQTGISEDKLIAFELSDGSATITADKVFVMAGPDLLSFSASSVSGTIEVYISENLA